MPSTAVRDIEYDPVSETLWVTFVPTAKRYAYRAVPLSVYEDFLHAFSKGTFFTASSATGTITRRWKMSEPHPPALAASHPPTSRHPGEGRDPASSMPRLHLRQSATSAATGFPPSRE